MCCLNNQEIIVIVIDIIIVIVVLEKIINYEQVKTKITFDEYLISQFICSSITVAINFIIYFNFLSLMEERYEMQFIIQIIKKEEKTIYSSISFMFIFIMQYYFNLLELIKIKFYMMLFIMEVVSMMTIMKLINY